MAAGDNYRYLAIVKNVEYCAPWNKNFKRISKEYLSRVKKIWSSELADFNKTITHDTFATPVIMPIVSIIDWTIENINQLDLKPRKNPTLLCNFHPNSDVDRLHMTKANNNRGMKRVKTLFEDRIVSISQHLITNQNVCYRI